MAGEGTTRSVVAQDPAPDRLLEGLHIGSREVSRLIKLCVGGAGFVFAFAFKLLEHAIQDDEMVVEMRVQGGTGPRFARCPVEEGDGAELGPRTGPRALLTQSPV